MDTNITTIQGYFDLLEKEPAFTYTRQLTPILINRRDNYTNEEMRRCNNADVFPGRSFIATARLFSSSLSSSVWMTPIDIVFKKQKG